MVWILVCLCYLHWASTEVLAFSPLLRGHRAQELDMEDMDDVDGDVLSDFDSESITAFCLVGIPTLLVWLVATFTAFHMDSQSREEQSAAAFKEGYDQQADAPQVKKEKVFSVTLFIIYFTFFVEFFQLSAFSFQLELPWANEFDSLRDMFLFFSADIGPTGWFAIFWLVVAAYLVYFVFMYLVEGMSTDPVVEEWKSWKLSQKISQKLSQRSLAKRGGTEATLDGVDMNNQEDEEEAAVEDASEEKKWANFFNRKVFNNREHTVHERFELWLEERPAVEKWVNKCYDWMGLILMETLFMPSMQILMSMASCTYSDVPYPSLDKDPEKECWSGAHGLYVSIGMLVIYLFYPMSLRLALGKNDDDPQFRFMLRFNIILLADEFALSGVATLFAHLTQVGLACTFLSLFSLTAFTIWVQPVVGEGAPFNHWRAASFGGALWSALVAVIVEVTDEVGTSWPFWLYLGMILPWVCGCYALSKKRGSVLEHQALKLVKDLHHCPPDRIHYTLNIVRNMSLNSKMREKFLSDPAVVSNIVGFGKKVNARTEDGKLWLAIVSALSVEPVGAITIVKSRDAEVIGYLFGIVKNESRPASSVPAAKALANLVMSKDGASKLFQLGALESLLTKARSRSPGLAAQSARALANMARRLGDEKKQYLKPKMLKQLNGLLSSTKVDDSAVKHGLATVMWLCYDEESRKKIVEAGMVPTLTVLAKSEHAHVREMADKVLSARYLAKGYETKMTIERAKKAWTLARRHSLERRNSEERRIGKIRKRQQEKSSGNLTKMSKVESFNDDDRWWHKLLHNLRSCCSRGESRDRVASLSMASLPSTKARSEKSGTSRSSMSVSESEASQGGPSGTGTGSGSGVGGPRTKRSASDQVGSGRSSSNLGSKTASWQTGLGSSQDLVGFESVVSPVQDPSSRPRNPSNITTAIREVNAKPKPKAGAKKAASSASLKSTTSNKSKGSTLSTSASVPKQSLPGKAVPTGKPTKGKGRRSTTTGQ